MNSVTIDSTFLAASTPPYILAANTVYTLSTDVAITDPTFFGEPFNLPYSNTVLVTAGHRITVGGKLVPQRLDSTMVGPTSSYAVRTSPENNPPLFYEGEFYEGRQPRYIAEPGSIGAPNVSTTTAY